MATYQGTFKKDFTEPKKVAIRRSRTTALFKSLVHVVPISFALYEIITNLHGRYIGASFDKQNYCQLVAKVHEVLIDASLASIVLSYVRVEATNNEGLPFGAFLGGLQFLSVSYLWSRELWSSVFATSCRIRTRVSFLLLMIVTGILAATSGPSSATLLIPREQLWELSPSYSVINATLQQIWPAKLDGQSLPEEYLVLNESSSNPICLASSWQGIHESISYEISYEGDDFHKLNSALSGYSYTLEGASDVPINGVFDLCFRGGLNEEGI